MAKRVTISTRKPVDELTPADFETFPIWEFATSEEGEDGMDETWVRPVKAKAVPENAYSQLVHAKFTTPTALTFHGLMTVTTAKNSFRIDGGSLLGKFGYLCIPDMARPEAESKGATWCIKLREDLVKALGLPEDEIFPLEYTLCVNISGEDQPRTGKVG